MKNNLIRNIALISLALTPVSSFSFDYNDNRGAIEAIKNNWSLAFVNYEGLYDQTTVYIDTIHRYLDAGYAATGSNIIEDSLRFAYPEKGYKGSDITCFYTNKPVNSSTQYNCFDNKASVIDYYEFNTQNDTITGRFHMKSIRILSDTSINFFTNFTGYSGSIPANAKYVDYSSTYNLIQWNKRGGDNFYCIDILDDNDNYYFRPIKCGNDMANFSPLSYVRDVMHGELPNGFSFRWKVWSKQTTRTCVWFGGCSEPKDIGIPNYAGQGYEGRVVVGQ